MPFVYTCIVTFSFSFSAHQTPPIFAAAITSYLFAAGTGALETIAEIPNKSFTMDLYKFFAPEEEIINEEEEIQEKL